MRTQHTLRRDSTDRDSISSKVCTSCVCPCLPGPIHTVLRIRLQKKPNPFRSVPEFSLWPHLHFQCEYGEKQAKNPAIRDPPCSDLPSGEASRLSAGRPQKTSSAISGSSTSGISYRRGNQTCLDDSGGADACHMWSVHVIFLKFARDS